MHEDKNLTVFAERVGNSYEILWKAWLSGLIRELRSELHGQTRLICRMSDISYCWFNWQLHDSLIKHGFCLTFFVIKSISAHFLIHKLWYSLPIDFSYSSYYHRVRICTLWYYSLTTTTTHMHHIRIWFV